MKAQESRAPENNAEAAAARKALSKSVKEVVISSLQSVTPARLGLLLFVNFLLIAMFCFAAVTTVQEHEHAVRTVGVDAAPSVIAAYEIKSAVAAMDADLASQLLYDADKSDARDMELDFDKWRVAACKQLVVAAKNITYGNAEQTPIENIQIALGKYEMQAQATRDFHKAKDAGAALKAYSAALDTVQNELIPNANKLEKADSEVLEATYSQEKNATNLSRGFVLVMGMVLICMLLYTQIYLISRFRRRICPPVILALIGVVFAVNHLTGALAANSQALKIAKEDAYDSVLALLNARSNAYNAGAAANRMLLDREHASAHEKSFNDSVSSVASFEGEHNFAETIERAEKELRLGNRLSLPGFRGALARELNNIRFHGEADAALESLRQFASYCQADSQVKELLKGGANAEAVHKCLSYGPSGAKFPFTRFDDALLQTLKINQDELDKKVKEAFEALSGLLVQTEAACLLAAVCVYIGLLPRMEEYFHCEPKSAHNPGSESVD